MPHAPDGLCARGMSLAPLMLLLLPVLPAGRMSWCPALSTSSSRSCSSILLGGGMAVSCCCSSKSNSSSMCPLVPSLCCCLRRVLLLLVLLGVVVLAAGAILDIVISDAPIRAPLARINVVLGVTAAADATITAVCC